MGQLCTGTLAHGPGSKHLLTSKPHHYVIAVNATDTNGCAQSGSLYYVVRYALNRLDLEHDKDSIARKAAAAAVLRRLDPHEADTKDGGRKKRSRKEDLSLNQYEQMVAMDVVAPDDIPVAFEGKMKSLFM